MERAHRFDRITPLETASLSFGLGLFLVWFSQVPSRALLPAASSLLVPSYLFAFAVCCALLARTRLPGSGSFARTIWLMPCLLLPLPLFGILWGPLKVPALLLPAFGAALFFCRWMTLCARFSPRLFLFLYCLSSLIALVGTLPLSQAAPLLHLLPLASTGLFLLAVRGRSWMPEGELYTEHTPAAKEGFGLLVFAILLNGVQAISASQLDGTGLVTPNVVKNAAVLLSLSGILILIRLHRPISYRSLLAGALALWAAGITLAEVSVTVALLLVSVGCTLFELSFWMLMLQFAVRSPNPARMICIGASLIAFALIASRLLLELLSPFGTRVLTLQSGFALFMGLVSILFLFLPRAIADSPAPASAATVEAAPDTVPSASPPAEEPADRELRLKGCFEALGLTRQECRIALMILEGAGDPELCGELFISKNTLKFHIRNINRKLGVASRRELPALADRLLSAHSEQRKNGDTAAPETIKAGSLHTTTAEEER